MRAKASPAALKPVLAIGSSCIWPVTRSVAVEIVVTKPSLASSAPSILPGAGSDRNCVTYTVSSSSSSSPSLGDCQPAWLEADVIDRGDDMVIARVDHRHRVGARVGYVYLVAVGRDSDAVRFGAHVDQLVKPDLLARAVQLQHRNVAVDRVRDIGLAAIRRKRHAIWLPPDLHLVDRSRFCLRGIEECDAVVVGVRDGHYLPVGRECERLGRGRAGEGDGVGGRRVLEQPGRRNNDDGEYPEGAATGEHRNGTEPEVGHVSTSLDGWLVAAETRTGYLPRLRYSSGAASSRRGRSARSQPSDRP